MDSAQVTHLLAFSEPDPLTVLAAELACQLGGLVDDCADIRQAADEVHPWVWNGENSGPMIRLSGENKPAPDTKASNICLW